MKNTKDCLLNGPHLKGLQINLNHFFTRGYRREAKGSCRLLPDTADDAASLDYLSHNIKAINA